MAKGIAHRRWEIRREDCRNEAGEIDDAVFRSTVEQEAVLNVHIMERLGVGIVSVPVREQWPDGSWHTAGYTFHTATVPGLRQPAPEVLVDLDDEPDVEADELAGVGLTDD